MPLLTLVFVLSGAAGLIYESIWSRYLGLFVGHSAYAQIIVLVIFLGGMSLGAWLAGERSARIQRPLLAYALVELAAGVIGLFFHEIFVAVTGAAYDAIFPALGGGSVTAVKWALAALLILPQSVLLGATFPLMSAGAIRLRPDRPGRVLGLLYFANSLGAAVGVLVAGFALIAWVGLEGTLQVAALLNLVVALAVVLADRGRREMEARVSEPSSPQTGEAAERTAPAGVPEPVATSMRLVPFGRLLLAVSFGTAIASFVYEIAWIRMLSLVLGSATHSFELMLSAFILGLALGALWVRGRADRGEGAVAMLGLVQWTMGVLAIATLPVYLASFRWMAALIDTFRISESGYSGFSIARYAICLVVMVPATFCAGMTLPLITRVLMTGGAGERAIGRVYAVNTLGSIVGVVLAGLVLMPVLGLEWLLVAGALVDIALGALLLARVVRAGGGAGGGRTTRLLALGAAATAVFVLATARLARFDHALLGSGVFRHGQLPEPGHGMRYPFWRDGRTATVGIRRTGDPGTLSLITNGKPDASLDARWLRTDTIAPRSEVLGSDVSTQVLLALVPLAHAPEAREIAVIGHGSGMTSHYFLGSPRVRRVTTIEIEPEMIAASRAFLPANRRAYEDPRSVFAIDDAKSYFASSSRRYDIVLSEPSNPWVSGVSGLFTREFYGRVRGYLAPGGVFAQWLHLYEIDDALVLSVLAALDESFPAYEVFLTASEDLVVIASATAPLRAPDWSVSGFPAIARDLRHVVPLAPEMLERARVLSRDVLHPLLAHERPNSDFEPVLDLGAERTRYLRRNAEGILLLGASGFDVVRALEGRRAGFGTTTRAPVRGIPRLSALAGGTALRAAMDGDTAAAARAGEPRYVAQQLALLARGAAAPADWRAWLSDVVALHEALHGGTAGVSDERFAREMRDYATRAGAPAPVLAALDFHRALAAWDWEAVSRAAPPLEREAAARRAWVEAGLLRDGVVVAALRRGDVLGARSALARLTRLAERRDAAFAFRTVLLQAQVRAAAEARRTATR